METVVKDILEMEVVFVLLVLLECFVIIVPKENMVLSVIIHVLHVV